MQSFDENEFTSAAAEQFVFELDQSEVRVTRSRRSSISSINNDLPKPRPKARRQTMLPSIDETKTVVAQKPKKTVTAKAATVVSPTKKISKSSLKTLNDEDILSKLDTSDPKPAKRSSASKVASKAKSPIKSRIPIKSPPSANKKEVPVRRSRRVSGDASSLAPAVKPSKRRQTLLPAISELKTSPVKKPVDVVKEVKKVEIKLRQMKLKEDPNVIYNMLEESVNNDDRVNVVVDQIVKSRKDASPVTRQKKVKVEKKSPKKKIKSPSKTPKVDLKPVKVEKETPKVDLKPVKVEKETPKVVKAKTTPEAKAKVTPKAEVKVSPKVEAQDTPVTASKKRKQTESKLVTPVQNKRLKLDKSSSKTPGSDKKPARVKVTPTLVARYKQRTPVPGSLKKPLKRLTAAKSTPAQVRPSDVLRRNMIKKVEKEIITKLNNRPDSSPYTLQSPAESGENSPVFSRVEPAKTHITGTPARTRPGRKFGTTLQPQSLLEESVAPGTEMMKRVSSSTPLRQRTLSESRAPHPLESVEATPIRPPPPAKHPPMSPPPEMVTGKLGSLCSIM